MPDHIFQSKSLRSWINFISIADLLCKCMAKPWYHDISAYHNFNNASAIASATVSPAGLRTWLREQLLCRLRPLMPPSVDILMGSSDIDGVILDSPTTVYVMRTGRSFQSLPSTPRCFSWMVFHEENMRCTLRPYASWVDLGIQYTVFADMLSRKTLYQTAWQLNKSSILKVQHLLPRIHILYDIDLFATRKNTQLINFL